MKTPDCNTCGGVDCQEGRFCPKREPLTDGERTLLRAIVISSVGFWVAIVGAAVAMWPQ